LLSVEWVENVITGEYQDYGAGVTAGSE